MTQIRIDTLQASETGRRIAAEGKRLEEIGYELQRAINSLDTYAWDGASRGRAEPMLSQVSPKSAYVAHEIQELGYRLTRVAEIFEQKDNTAAQDITDLPWINRFFPPGPGWRFPLPIPLWPPRYIWQPFPWPPRYWPWLPILPILPILPPWFRPPWRWLRPGIPKPKFPLPAPFPEPEPAPSPQPVSEDTDTGSGGEKGSKSPGHASPPKYPAPDVPSGFRRIDVNPEARAGDCVDYVEDHRKVPSPILTWQNGGVDDNWNYGPVPKPGAIMVEGYDPEIGIGREIDGTKWGHVSYVDWVEYNDAGEPIRFHVVEGGWNGEKHEQTFDWPIGGSSRRHPHRFIYDKK